MGWVKDYSSAFWRVIREVMKGLEIASENDPWFSYLVWSNLYKVSPAEGGNPGNKLCCIQLKGCKSLFDTELDIYRPSRLLLLAGWDWARDFVTNDCRTHNNAGFVEATGRRRKTRIVVARHPQGKPEAEWVKDVLAAFAWLALEESGKLGFQAALACERSAEVGGKTGDPRPLNG